MKEEIWVRSKSIYGKEISSFGNLRNARTGQIRKLRIGRGGYHETTVTIFGKSKNVKIHRLVAEAFIPNPEGKPQVNHKDLNKLNNNVENLEWCTQLENIQHYWNNGFKGKVSDDQVLYIRKNIETIGFVKLAKELGVNELYVLSIANGRYKPNIHTEFIRPKKPSLPRVVTKHTVDGNLVETYQSISQAAKANGTEIRSIQRVASGERKTFGGFVYKCDGYKQTKRKKSNIASLLKWKEKQRLLSQEQK